jgi:CheY-like chemotaxis protein
LTATSQRAAARLLTRERVTPDVLIVDYHLDEADGLEAVVSLRWKLGRPIPAILVTADRSPSLRADAAEKDVQALMKPLRPAALRALLAQLVTRRMAAE